jgi:hydrogenase maturation protease
MRTIVVGLGNPILSDDRVGIRGAGRARQRLGTTSGVDVIEAYAGGLRLMEAIAGYERAIIVDAVTGGLQPPGTIRLFSPDTTVSTRNTLCTHDSDLATVLALGRDLGLKLPDRVEIVGIEADEVERFSEELTPRVAAALPEAVNEVLRRCGVTKCEAKGQQP